MNDPEQLRQALVGKTVRSAEVGTAHGEVIRLELTDGTKIAICSYVGTSGEKEHYPDDLFVSINGQET